MASAGFAVGLIVGGLLTEWLTWRSVLFINVPLGVAAIGLAVRFLPASPGRRARLDLAGAATATAGMGALVYGLIRAASHGWSDPLTVGFLVAGAALLAGFLTAEARASEPLMPLRLFADRNRATAYLTFFLLPAAAFSMFFFLTQYLQDIRGMSALATGFAFVPMAATLFAVTRLIPRLLPRFGPKVLAMACTSVMCAGFAVLSRVSVDSGYVPLVLAPMVLVGLGMGLAASPLNVVIMGSVPAADSGAAGGVLQTMQQVGATLGLAVLVTVFGTVTGQAASVGEPAKQVMVTGMTAAFTGSVIIAALAFLVSLTFRRRT